jgi:starch phosphorylase
MKLNPNERRSVAYFSMEIGIDERIYTYSGGLGVLAGDTIRSAADLKVPMVAVTLLYRKGYNPGPGGRTNRSSAGLAV